MKTLKQLINNINGQVNGISKMLESDRDCTQVLTQIKAARSALDALAKKYLESKILECFPNLEKSRQKNLEKLLQEITKK